MTVCFLCRWRLLHAIVEDLFGGEENIFFCRLQILDKAKLPNSQYILAWEIGDIFEEKVFGCWNLIQELSYIIFGIFKNINMCQECSLKLNRKICTCKWL